MNLGLIVAGSVYLLAFFVCMASEQYAFAVMSAIACATSFLMTEKRDNQ